MKRSRGRILEFCKKDKVRKRSFQFFLDFIIDILKPNFLFSFIKPQ